MATALIIGGNRFFGKHLTANLLDRGFAVSHLNRGQIDDGFGKRVTRLVADRSIGSQLEMAVNGKEWDVIFDQVAFDADAARLACRVFAGKTNRYVFTSTISVYPQHQKSMDESAFQPISYNFEKTIFREQDYGEAKRQAEAIFAREAPCPTAFVRLPWVVGHDDYTRRLHWHIERVKMGRPIHFPCLNAWVNFIHSADAGRALVEIGLSSATGAVNCASPGDIRLREMIAWIEEATGRSAEWTDRADDEFHSPYGVEADWSMNLTRLKDLGIELPPSSAWLPDLIKAIAKN